MTLRLASYNLHKCKGTDRRRDPGRVVDVLNALDADVIALQEVDHRLGDRPQALPREMVEKDTDHDALDLALSPVSLGWHGQTLLVRSSLQVRDMARIELPGLEPRGAVMAELETASGKALRVVGVHLGLIRRYRLMQMRALRAALAGRVAMPTAILGDFNEWSLDRGMEPLADAFSIHAPGRSYHANRPVAALDRVALDQRLELRDAGVSETALSRMASDHLPIWADIAVDDDPAATSRGPSSVRT
jgi:endonuclease/exonuclease/phosphatase family metal-dependent hydrolase